MFRFLRSDRFLLASFVLAIFGQIAIGGFLLRNIENVREVTNRRAMERTIGFKIRQVNALLTDAETGQRGFVLTSDETYLQPYHRALEALPAVIEELKQAFTGEPEQMNALVTAKSLIDQKLSELNMTIELVRGANARDAISLVRKGHGRDLMLRLQTELDRLGAEQNRQIQKINADVANIISNSSALVLIGSTCAALIVTGLVTLLYRNRLRSREWSAKIISTQNKIALSPVNRRAVLKMVTSLSMDLTSADASIVEIADGEDLVYQEAIGMAEPFLGMRIPRAGSFSGLCLESGKTLVCDDSEIDTRVNREACRKVGLRSMIVAPLVHNGNTIGVLKNYSAKPNHFDETTYNALTVITGLLSSALGHASEFEEKVSAILDLEKAKAELTISRDEARSATEAKSRFLANMSHEVRTPLNGILGMSNILLDDTAVGSRQRDYVNAIKNSGESLLAIVNEILDFSKIEAGRMDLEKLNFDIVSTAQDVIKSFAYLAGQKKLNLNFETDAQIPPILNGDPGRIRQILINLIGNALKFTSEGTVDLKIKVEDAKGSQVKLRFDLHDTGIGMSQEVLQNLFTEFTQADASTTRKFGGTGLGLAISKRLVEQMSGELRVESRTGCGSHFWFTIELAREQETEVREGEFLALIPIIERPWRILIGEDNQVNQIIIKKMLEKLGLQGDLAGNGKEVAEAMQTRPYDLILLDCHMPEMDGYDATHFIRTNKSIVNNEIPIIAMTANALKGDREKVLAAGMNDYVSKPIDPKILRTVLAKWLHHLVASMKGAA